MSGISEPTNNIIPAAGENVARSTEGMTTKVVKGSIWTLAGQVLPMMVALIATPFTIRFLGSEGYGVLILVGLIPTYFSFADFGMGIASTKFGSEAYGDGDPEKEGEIVRTAAVIALCTSLLFAVPIFLFSWPIVTAFNVPEHFQTAANIALKITSVSFVLGILSSVLNTPMLARLRMDLNTAASSVPKILMALFTPFVLYLGGGVVEAVWVGFFAAIVGIVGILFISGRLLPQLFRLSINSEYLRPLVKFGGGLVIGGIAALLLINLEKIVLTRIVSVQSLAYYSVAFTFANMATMFSFAMIQSLIPAFSQLLTSVNRTEFENLFSSAVRLNLTWLLPAVCTMAIAAKPFFSTWAGSDFGFNSSAPFYILLFGLFFNILAFVSHSAITAFGRTDVFAKLYWIELGGYAIVATYLVFRFQIIGAALAWSLRVIVDSVVVILICKKVVGVEFRFSDHLFFVVAGLIVLSPPLIFAFFVDNFSYWLIPIGLLSFLVYSTMIWNLFLRHYERTSIRMRLEGWFRMQK